MMRFVVEAFAENVFVPAPVMATFPSAFDAPVIVPESVCALVPLKVIVAELFVYVPFWAKLPEIERLPEAGATTVAPVFMKRFVVDALFEKVFVPAPRKAMLPSAEEPVSVPAIDCADAELNVVVAELFVKVPLFDRLPVMASPVEWRVTVPAVMVKFVVVDVVAIVQLPLEPFKVTFPIDVGGGRMVFPVVVALNVSVCELGVNVADDEARKLPASVVSPPAVYVELGLRRSEPSSEEPEGPFPRTVTAPPGAKVSPVHT
jgi:hypothetical protein